MVFCFEFCEFFKNTFSTEHLQWLLLSIAINSTTNIFQAFNLFSVFSSLHFYSPKIPLKHMLWRYWFLISFYASFYETDALLNARKDNNGVAILNVRLLLLITIFIYFFHSRFYFVVQNSYIYKHKYIAKI